jgi:hypothetical protein
VSAALLLPEPEAPAELPGAEAPDAITKSVLFPRLEGSENELFSTVRSLSRIRRVAKQVILFDEIPFSFPDKESRSPKKIIFGRVRSVSRIGRVSKLIVF